MKNRKWLLISFIVLVVFCLLAFGSFFLFRAINQAKTPPLIQIHTPYNHEQLYAGKGVIIHATADAQDGMASMELWVDNTMLSAVEVEEDVPSPKLVISSGWVPYPKGDHRIIVRATTEKGVSSQASIHIEAVDFPSQASTSYIVQEADTLESIAEAFDIHEEDILEVNEELDPAGALDPGEELTLPPEEPDIPAPFDPGPGGDDGEIPVDDPEPEDEPDTDEDPPDPPEDIDPPLLDIFDFFFNIDFPTQLQIEVLSLETEEAYSFLHCYASLADAVPQWVPDEDFDQSTDESFFSMSGEGNRWDVADHFANENAMNLTWMMSEPVPLDISCVGVAEGGTEAIELGRVVDQVDPERWGVIQSAYSTEGESSFFMTYKVSHPAKGLDDSITPPYNVQLSEEDQLLSWEYPPDELETIDGFAVLLNDTLQWTTYRSIQETSLPQEWFNLPCGDEYRFNVVAYRMGYPDGDYSNPSDPAIIAGDEVGTEGCNRTVIVTFETLTTGALGRNPSPVYGSFFANDHMLEFDGRPIEGDNFPSTFGLRQNDRYNIGTIMYGFGNDQTQLVVEIPPGRPGIEENPLWLGFEIYQGGSNVCSGDLTIGESRLAGSYSGTIETERPIGSLPDWCVINYTIQSLGDTPVVEPGAEPPLPDLRVQKITRDHASGRPKIHIRNLGLSSWVEQDLEVQVTSYEGEQVGIFEWHHLTLGPGETLILSHGALDPEPSLGICVLLDPNNNVEEQIDRSIAAGMFTERQPYCRPLPDLVIDDVTYNNETSILEIDITNQGENPISAADDGGTLDHDNLMVWLEFEDGRPMTQEYTELDLSLRETTTLVWPISELERERMRSGYTVRINPARSIAEADFSNNEYEVGEVAKLRILWKVGWANFCETGNTSVFGENIGGKNTWTMHLTANVQDANGSRRVAGWDAAELELTWRDGNVGDFWCHNYLSDWFEVAGDESLLVTTWTGLDIVGHGYRWIAGQGETLTAADDFGGTIHFPAGTDESCLNQPVSYRYICRGTTWCTGGCGELNCSRLGDAGEHRMVAAMARSEDIVNSCYWNTTYIIFREVEE